MAAFRSLVAVLVTVLALFGGAFRAETVLLRAQVAVQNATAAAEHATLDVDRPIVQGRTTRPSTPDSHDGFGAACLASPSRAAPVARAVAQIAIATAPTTEERHRRVRPHVEHMVFLI